MSRAIPPIRPEAERRNVLTALREDGGKLFVLDQAGKTDALDTGIAAWELEALHVQAELANLYRLTRGEQSRGSEQHRYVGVDTMHHLAAQLLGGVAEAQTIFDRRGVRCIAGARRRERQRRQAQQVWNQCAAVSGALEHPQ